MKKKIVYKIFTEDRAFEEVVYLSKDRAMEDLVSYLNDQDLGPGAEDDWLKGGLAGVRKLELVE